MCNHSKWYNCYLFFRDILIYKSMDSGETKDTSGYGKPPWIFKGRYSKMNIISSFASLSLFFFFIDSAWQPLCVCVCVYFVLSALYQLHLVKAKTARACIPKDFRLVEAFGYFLGPLKSLFEIVKCYHVMDRVIMIFWILNFCIIRQLSVVCLPFAGILLEDSFLPATMTALQESLMRFFFLFFIFCSTWSLRIDPKPENQFAFLVRIR